MSSRALSTCADTARASTTCRAAWEETRASPLVVGRYGYAGRMPFYISPGWTIQINLILIFGWFDICAVITPFCSLCNGCSIQYIFFYEVMKEENLYADVQDMFIQFNYFLFFRIKNNNSRLYLISLCSSLELWPSLSASRILRTWRYGRAS